MNSLKWTTDSGRKIELQAQCEMVVIDDTVNLDGDVFIVGKKISTLAMLKAFVDDVEVENCFDINFWKVIDAGVGNNIMRIHGIQKIGFVAARAGEVAEFLTTVIESGKSEEVKEFEMKKCAEKTAKERARAEKIVKRAENTVKNSDGTLMSEREAAAWQRNYNNLHNEGGEGYIPEIITKEQYDNAMKILKI